MGEGTGLGLSIVYGIMKNIFGSIKVENRNDEGTKVILTFPIAEDQNQPSD
ncbi:MAG: hypothetical protein JJT78_14545 [Leptospira sp.]|nr:hypothetical protein [Leptospira sp.]